MAYINGIGIISPQKTGGSDGFLMDIVEHTADYLRCIDPNYRDYIDPMQARRMSRLIKMGITSAKMALSDSGCRMPDAIITGTGLGSVEDTERLLGSIHLDEPLLNPTPFMQSTYNTISSQVAINLKCHGYNSTYVHRTFSFESCLLDALLQIEEKTADDILAGGIDEMTMNHLTIIRRLGDWKMQPESNLKILEHSSAGALAGEGSGYFLISSKRSEKSYASLKGVATFYRPADQSETEQKIIHFINEYGLSLDDIEVFLTGINGDRKSDRIYYRTAESLFPAKSFAYFKHLCGEYFTAMAFGLWVAANAIRMNSLPPTLLVNTIRPQKIRNILLYNQYKGVNHSLILVSE